MTSEKGVLRRVADAVGNAVQTVAAGVGLGGSDAGTPVESKSARKVRRKATIARVESAEHAVKVARRSSR